MATGIELEDEAIPIINAWKKTKKGNPICIVFKIHSKRGWVVEKQSDGSKSAKEQFNDIRGSFTDGQSRIWFAKVSYDKEGHTREDIVYLCRRGQNISKVAFKYRMIYPAGGSVLKEAVGNVKYTHEYEHKEADYDTIAKALADRV